MTGSTGRERLPRRRSRCGAVRVRPGHVVRQADRTELVTHGVFARVRNPIFTAMIAAQAGTARMAPTWLSLLGVRLLLVGIELQVRRIEDHT